jgi:hypothetical protein
VRSQNTLLGVLIFSLGDGRLSADLNLLEAECGWMSSEPRQGWPRSGQAEGPTLTASPHGATRTTLRTTGHARAGLCGAPIDGTPPGSDDYVFPTVTGGPQNPSNIRNRVRWGLRRRSRDVSLELGDNRRVLGAGRSSGGGATEHPR